MNFDNQTNCKNCEEPLTTRFCGHCGQEKATRITFKELLKTIQMGLLEFRSPFLHTFKMMTIAPGKVCRDYVEGKRERYFNPIKYALWTITITVFVSAFTNHALIDLDFYNGLTNANSDPHKTQFQEGLQAFIESSHFFSAFGLAAAYALVLRLLFRKQGFNLFEMYILAIFPVAQTTWVTTVLVAFGWFSTTWGIALASIIGFMFCTYTFTTFFDGKWFKNFVKAVTTYIFAVLLFTFILGLSAGFALGIDQVFHEDEVQQHNVSGAAEQTKPGN